MGIWTSNTFAYATATGHFLGFPFQRCLQLLLQIINCMCSWIQVTALDSCMRITHLLFVAHIRWWHIVRMQIDKMVDETLSVTQCDSCFETATSARTLNGVCAVSPAVVHCVNCVQNLCVSCCSRVCKMQSTHDDVCCTCLAIFRMCVAVGGVCP